MQKFTKIAAVVLLVAVMAVGAVSLAGKPAPNPCPTGKPGCFCPMIYDPVLCNGGCQYSNACVARCAGAGGCQPIGPGPIEL